MREADKKCYSLCSYQANIFSKSLEKTMCSSKVFLRRFFYSNFAFRLDFNDFYTFSFDENDCFNELLEEFGDSSYGRSKMNEKILHYVGYITRYICYTREVTSLFVYRTFGLDTLIKQYYVLHTQSEEYAIRVLLENKGLTEDIFDQDKLLKDVFKKRYQGS